MNQIGIKMETVLLSRFIVIQSDAYPNTGSANTDKNGFAVVGEPSVLSPLVKIEAERAEINDRYVHLRFCHTNKYWARKEGRFIIAESNVPEEDTTKPSCTLFEAVSAPGGDGLFSLNHVQSGGRVFVEFPSMRFSVSENIVVYDATSVLRRVNWDGLVKLPKHVAFKGYNGKYLQGVWAEKRPFLQFGSNDPNELVSEYEISQLPDGHLRIYSKHFTKYWRRDNQIMRSGWIWADAIDTTAINRDTLFWPVKIDDNTIALRNTGNNNFCKALTADNKTNCLDAASPTITNEARLVVQELVMRRRIYNVRYRMKDCRIYNVRPFFAGTTAAFNFSDTEAAVGVEVGYVDFRSRCFSRSLSLTAGVASTVEFGLPKIVGGSIVVEQQMSTALEWNDNMITEVAAKGTGLVRVPPRSLATVCYVGTIGTCDVPFSYTQQDTRSMDGKPVESDHIDGVYTGVNAYNFCFVVEKTQPL